MITIFSPKSVDVLLQVDGGAEVGRGTEVEENSSVAKAKLASPNLTSRNGRAKRFLTLRGNLLLFLTLCSRNVHQNVHPSTHALLRHCFNPFTPKLKKYILPTF